MKVDTDFIDGPSLNTYPFKKDWLNADHLPQSIINTVNVKQKENPFTFTIHIPMKILRKQSFETNLKTKKAKHKTTVPDFQLLWGMPTKYFSKTRWLKTKIMEYSLNQYLLTVSHERGPSPNTAWSTCTFFFHGSLPKNIVKYEEVGNWDEYLTNTNCWEYCILRFIVFHHLYVIGWELQG